MDLNTLEVSVEEATARLAEYEAMVASERTAEDEAIAQGYRSAKRGFPIIRMTETIAAGGWFDNGLPRLAVIRADATTCHVTISHRRPTTDVLFADSARAENRGALVGRHTVRVTVPSQPAGHRWRGQTIVPIIPPRHRPKPHRLAHCHILWEVEEWSNVVPVDPALVRHIRGDLWSVLATWDLSDLERAVLAQRAAG